MKTTRDHGSNWYRLDNAAKIYPAILKVNNSCSFRIAINLTQDIIPEVLRQAVIDCKPRFPSIYVKLKKGLFWHYYEHNTREPIVKPESPSINQLIDLQKNNDYLFTVFFYKNRVSIEAFHGLCDGGGAFELLKAIVYRYFELLGYDLESDGLVLTLDQAPDQAEVEDSFTKQYTSTPRDRGGVEKAYRIQGVPFSIKGDIGVINGKLQVDQLLHLARKSKATITQYLATLFIYSIGQDELAQASDNPINISIPVNLRPIYDSRTLRNFSLFFHLSIACKNNDWQFESLLEQVKKQFERGLNKERLQQNLNSNVAVEKNIIFRALPLFVKNAVVRMASVRLGDNLTTCTLSNLGRIQLPRSIADLVKDFECNMGVNSNSTHNVSLVTYNNHMTISFSRSVYDTQLEHRFFTYLTDRGIDLEIQSNLRENFPKE